MSTVAVFAVVATATYVTFALCYGVVEAIGYALAADEDDTYAPEPVDRALWEPNAPLWQETSTTPIFDALAAERLRAELDDDEGLYAWMEATP